MANKTITDYAAAGSIDASADYLLLEQSSVYKKINRNTLLGLSSAPLGLTDSQSPTNKVFDNTNQITLKDNKFTLQDDGDTTKQMVFQLSGITSGQTRTLTVPDASGTLVTTAATQTLTSKTLTSPTITGGTYDNGTITVDSISGHTSATIVTVANLQISNGVLNTNNSVVASNITAGAVQPQALQSGTGSGWGFTSWTPTWSGNPTALGNATQASKYIQIGKTVICRIQFTVGSTTTFGTATMSGTLPVTAVSHIAGTNLGMVYIFAPGYSTIANVRYLSTTTFDIQSLRTDGTYISEDGFSATVPVTWTTGATISGMFMYEAA